MGFWKTTQSELYNYQLEKLIVCLYFPGKDQAERREDKNKNPVASYLVVIGTANEMNETISINMSIRKPFDKNSFICRFLLLLYVGNMM